jgi:hypothetical protein
MPTKRRRTTRGRSVLTPESFTFSNLMDFIFGWSPLGSCGESYADNPDVQARETWLTWQEFLADWVASATSGTGSSASNETTRSPRGCSIATGRTALPTCWYDDQTNIRP